MKGLKLLGSEFLAICRNRKLLVPIIAVLMVPVLYSGMFLGAFWDPYERLDQLPVAVVNMDEGATLDNKDLHIGDELVGKLKEEEEGFKWDFVDLETAQKGLEHEKYYMMIKIPENFSQNATTLKDETPEHLQLEYIPNESYNFLSSQIGSTAVLKIKEKLSKTVTETYAEEIFGKIAEAGDGIQEAADGSKELDDRLPELQDGSVKLVDGAGQVKDGLVELYPKTVKLNDGLQQLAPGAGKLATGLEQLAPKAVDLNTALQQLSLGSNEVTKGLESLSETVTNSNKDVGKKLAPVGDFAQSLDKVIDSHPGLKVEEKKQLKSLLVGLTSSMKDMTKGQEQLLGAINQLKDGSNKVSKGLVATSDGTTKLSNAVTEVSAGMGKVSGAITEMSSQTPQLVNGVGQLKDGSIKVADGSTKITDGLDKVKDGTSKLATGLAEGAEKSGEVQGDQKKYEMLAGPVEVKEEKYTPVPNYGTGFAPYFLSLGLFVGALLISIVFPLRESAGTPTSGFSWFISKFGVLLFVGIAQALISVAILLFVLGIEVQSIPLFILFSIVTSLAFLTLVQFLVTTFSDAGRFVAIIILILQLTTSAGTFPLELIPEWLQAFNAWLPMTYSVAGLKAVISSGDFSFMWDNTFVLFIFIAGAMAGTIAVLTLFFKREYGVVTKSVSKEA